MNPKKVVTIVGCCLAILIIPLIIIAVIFFGNNSDYVKPNENTNINASTIDQIKTEEQFEIEHKELQKKIKEVYGTKKYSPVKPFKFEDEGEIKEIYDILYYCEKFPSQELSQLKGNDILYKKDIYEFKENINKYNKNLLTEEQTKEGVTYLQEFFTFDLKGYNTVKEDMHNTNFYLFNSDENSKNLFISSCQFENEKEYYQACYDALLEMCKLCPEKDIASVITNSSYLSSFETVELAAKQGDYRPFFDALMNNLCAFTYTDENGIFYRVETDKLYVNDDDIEDHAFIITTLIDLSQTK